MIHHSNNNDVIYSKVKAFKIINLNPENITLPLLKKHRNFIAKLIQKQGDVYLPLYIRLEKEIKTRQENEYYKQRALRLAKKQVP